MEQDCNQHPNYFSNYLNEFNYLHYEQTNEVLQIDQIQNLIDQINIRCKENENFIINKIFSNNYLYEINHDQESLVLIKKIDQYGLDILKQGVIIQLRFNNFQKYVNKSDAQIYQNLLYEIQEIHLNLTKMCLNIQDILSKKFDMIQTIQIEQINHDYALDNIQNISESEISQSSSSKSTKNYLTKQQLFELSEQMEICSSKNQEKLSKIQKKIDMSISNFYKNSKKFNNRKGSEVGRKMSSKKQQCIMALSLTLMVVVSFQIISLFEFDENKPTYSHMKDIQNGEVTQSAQYHPYPNEVKHENDNFEQQKTAINQTQAVNNNNSNNNNQSSRSQVVQSDDFQLNNNSNSDNVTNNENIDTSQVNQTQVIQEEVIESDTTNSTSLITPEDLDDTNL